MRRGELQTDLENLNYQGTVQDFYDHIERKYIREYRSNLIAVDEFVARPTRMALPFVQAVRDELNVPNLDEYAVLSTVLTLRKQGKL